MNRGEAGPGPGADRHARGACRRPRSTSTRCGRRSQATATSTCNWLGVWRGRGNERALWSTITRPFMGFGRAMGRYRAAGPAGVGALPHPTGAVWRCAGRAADCRRQRQVDAEADGGRRDAGGGTCAVGCAAHLSRGGGAEASRACSRWKARGRWRSCWRDTRWRAPIWTGR